MDTDTTEVTATLEVSGIPLTGRYQGGNYINLFRPGKEYPLDAINVWDYGTDAPSITNTRSAVWTAMKEWVANLEPGDFAKILENHR